MLVSKKNTTVNKCFHTNWELYIVFVKLQQIIFQNITTSSHPHIKNIDFVMQKSSTQNNTVVQLVLFVNRIQYKFTCLLLCLLNFCHIKTYVRK